MDITLFFFYAVGPRSCLLAKINFWNYWNEHGIVLLCKNIEGTYHRMHLTQRKPQCIAFSPPCPEYSVENT